MRGQQSDFSPKEASGTRDSRVTATCQRCERTLNRWRRLLTVALAATLTVLLVLCMGVGVQYVRAQSVTAHEPETTATELPLPQIMSSATSSAAAADNSQLSTAQAASVALNNLTQVNTADQFAVAGFTLDDSSRTQLEQALRAFTDNGYQISFALADMSSGSALASNGAAVRYPASAIKAPYVVSLLQTGAIDLEETAAQTTSAGQYAAQLIEPVLRYSDNDNYDTLFAQYGSTPIITWANGIVENPARMQGFQYPDVSATELAKMWVNTYAYLASKESGSQAARNWLGSNMIHSLNSAIDAAHTEPADESASAIVLSKAGWISGEGDYYALNDAGIILPAAGSGARGYVLAMMSDACGRNDLLTQLAGTLDDIVRSQMRAAEQTE